MNSPTAQSLDHQERKLISQKSIIAFGSEMGSPDPNDRSLDGSTVPELTTLITTLKQTKPTTPDQIAQYGTMLRKYASRLCSIGTMEACECIIKVIGPSSVSTPSVAKYGLTAIANCTSNEETRSHLMKCGAGEFIVHMLKTFGEEHFSVAQYGIIAITNLTSTAEIRNVLGELGACQLIVKLLKTHALKEEAPVAVYGLYAIGKLSLNHDQNRQRFGSCGGCEEVVEVLKRLGEENHTITDYGMYALAHLAYFNLDNKKRLSNVDTYKIIMSLVRKHGKEQISIASFGLTAVSNLIHTDSSKEKFGTLGMCELVQELGNHYKMKPEALANNVIFTIGKLAHKHPENGRLLAKQSVGLVVQSLQMYGVEKITQAGNGLFALSALTQNNNSAMEKIVTVEVVELVMTLLCVHAADDSSIAIYGLTILEAIVSFAMGRGDVLYSFLYQSLVHLKIGTLSMNIIRVYSYNAQNCNVEVLCRAVNLLHVLYVMQDNGANSKPESIMAEIKAQLESAEAPTLLTSAILNNVVIMEKHTNDHTLEVLGKLMR